MLLSIVIPVYQAENIVDELMGRIRTVMDSIEADHEVILVEDGSRDRSWQKIAAQCSQDKNIKGIKLSRNFGQHYAITCGLDHCTGDWIVVMDCDLQDRPEHIPVLFQKAIEGYDIVYAKRAKRKDGLGKKILSRLFYRVYSYLTGIPYDGTIGNFGIYSKKVIDTVRAMREPLRAFSPMVRWTGFNSAALDLEHDKRFEGRSSYNYRKVVNLAADIILSYSDKPLKIMIRLGFLISGISFGVGIYYLARYLSGKILVSGYTSIIISIWFLGGLIILNLGLIGLYISKIFTGIKERPLYIIDKSINQ